eukprot:CAMPEP_0172909662 /NCGR_PEP_ID=MMETSP1075-20121228/183119_1 /TAXON_ID=2916 /ORGANISM="Ceratium fusus, Strain PA161109" /LENGTH=79 /DNA_ID=CAMNT_0013767669 /DNA_START=238 /DNA_END=473 /DNA_ORIENTATION=+
MVATSRDGHTVAAVAGVPTGGSCEGFVVGFDHNQAFKSAGGGGSGRAVNGLSIDCVVESVTEVPADPADGRSRAAAAAA